MSGTARAPCRILDPDDPKVEPYRALRERDAAARRNGFIAEGLMVLERAVASGRYPLASVLASEARWSRVEPLAERLPPTTELYVASQAVLDAICGFPLHRGVLAHGRAPALPCAEALLAGLGERALVVCAMGVNDPDNMGAIFRNAAALGASAALVDAQSCDPFYRRAIRVSVGAALSLPCARLAPDEDAIALLHRCGIEPIALSPAGATPLKALAPSGRMALLLGAEGPGLPASVLARVRTVRIPMAAGFDSLNVAAASAVALHHLTDG